MIVFKNTSMCIVGTNLFWLDLINLKELNFFIKLIITKNINILLISNLFIFDVLKI